MSAFKIIPTTRGKGGTEGGGETACCKNQSVEKSKVLWKATVKQIAAIEIVGLIDCGKFPQMVEVSTV